MMNRLIKNITYAFLIFLFVNVFLTNTSFAQNPMNIYGYFSTRYEKSFSVPTANGANVDYANAPGEFTYPFVNIMMQNQLTDQFRVFINLNGAKGGNLDMRNFWGEYSAASYFNVRIGKMYRKFGLYNEILDAVPTYYGIEPPEMFDTDHLFISRTTMAMIHGNVELGDGNLNYALSTDNGEGQTVFESAIPINFDLNYAINGELGNFIFGTSYYNSGGATDSDIDMGKGSPKSGVLPWMTKDSFNVINGYFEAKIGALTLQFEYAQTNHKALRSKDAIFAIVSEAGINDNQKSRFLIDKNAPPSLDNVNTVGDYTASTWYTRVGYSFETSVGEIAPYFQIDAFSNPELIANKDFGGDDEAGLADDGKFTKLTGGVVFRPVSQVALKLDASTHNYKFNGQNVSYPEVRLDLSYTFGM